MKLFDEQYKKPSYSIPYGKNLDKGAEDYFIQFSEAIYSLYCRGLTGITPQDVEEFRLYRQYASGQQREELYMNLLMGAPESPSGVSTAMSTVDVDLLNEASANKNTKRKGYMNLLWDIVSPADKIVSSLVGKFSKIVTDIRVDNVDLESVDAKDMIKYDLVRYMENKDFEDLYDHMAGLPPRKEEMMPESLGEVDIMEQEGAFRMPYAIAMEQVSSTIEKLSNWEELKDKLYRDLLATKTAIVAPYYDEPSNTPRGKYIDPEMAVIQYSKHPDFKDAEYGGYFEYVQVGELIEKGVIKGYDDLKGLSEKYAGTLNNPSIINLSAAEDADLSSNYNYDDFKVLVFKVFWIDNDVRKDVRITNKFGGVKVVPYDGQKISKNMEIRITQIRKVYQCSWVLGSKIVYDWGVFEDMVRKNKNEVNFPMFVYRMDGRSLMKQIRPFFDALMINWLRYQDAIATAKKAGWAIDYNAIANLKVGGEKNPEKETIKRLIQTGVFIFKGTSPGGRPNTYSKPIYDIGGGIAGQLAEFIEAFRFNAELIENFSGINPLVLGGQGDKGVALGAQQIAVSGTDNTLQPYLTAVQGIQRRFHDYTIDWVQLLIKYNDDARDAMTGMVGKRNIDILVKAEANNVRYGCFITPAVTDFEKQELIESAKIALQNGRNGTPGITEADYAYILHMLQSRTSLKLIHLFLDRRIKKSRKEAERLAQQNMLMDRQATAQVNQQKAQGDYQLLLTKDKMEKENLQLKTELRLREIQAETEGQKEVEAIRNTKYATQNIE